MFYDAYGWSPTKCFFLSRNVYILWYYVNIGSAHSSRKFLLEKMLRQIFFNFFNCNWVPAHVKYSCSGI